MFKPPTGKSGFTLIELLIVIVIIALLLGILLPNMLGMRERARDSRLKSELRELKLVLEVFHEDNQGYPADDDNGGMVGCESGGADVVCPLGGAFEKAGIVYMPVLPEFFTYDSIAPDGFRVSWELENLSDQDAQRSQSKCGLTPDPADPTYYECAM